MGKRAVYFKDTDSLIFDIAEREEGSATREVEENVLANVNPDGEVWGVEIMGGASERFDVPLWISLGLVEVYEGDSMSLKEFQEKMAACRRETADRA